MNIGQKILLSCLMLLLTVSFASDSYARKVKGIDFPDTQSIGGKQCKLNGVGIRKKVIINVYVAGLYLEKPTKNAAQVINSDQAKRVHIEFLYKEVRADQLTEAWDEGLAGNAGSLSPALRAKFAKFNAMFTESLKKGETMTFTYIPGTGTDVTIKGRSKGVIEGADFMKALFSVWFGPKPPNKGLKTGMLDN